MLVRVPIVRLASHQSVYACEPDFNEYRNPYPIGSRDYQFLEALYALHRDIKEWTASSGIPIKLYVPGQDRANGYSEVDIIINEEDIGWYAFMVNHKVATWISTNKYHFTGWVTAELTQVPYENDKEFDTTNQG